MPSVELMTTETFNLGEAAVGVADLFEGTNPPVEFLTKRAGDMLRANPCIVVFSPKPGRIAISGMALSGWDKGLDGDMIDGPVEFFKPPPGPVEDFSRTNGDE